MPHSLLGLDFGEKISVHENTVDVLSMELLVESNVL
jgi:hypothetical protein